MLSYLEENECHGILVTIETNWKYPCTCNEMLDVIYDTMNDTCYMYERDELMEEIEFLQNITYELRVMENN